MQWLQSSGNVSAVYVAIAYSSAPERPKSQLTKPWITGVHSSGTAAAVHCLLVRKPRCVLLLQNANFPRTCEIKSLFYPLSADCLEKFYLKDYVSTLSVFTKWGEFLYILYIFIQYRTSSPWYGGGCFSERALIGDWVNETYSTLLNVKEVSGGADVLREICSNLEKDQSQILLNGTLCSQWMVFLHVRSYLWA